MISYIYKYINIHICISVQQHLVYSLRPCLTISFLPATSLSIYIYLRRIPTFFHNLLSSIMLYTGGSSNAIMHALALLVIFISLALPAYSSSNSSNSEVFLPVNIREYEAAMGIQRRAEEDLVDMRPKPHADLIYGRPGKNEQILLAHMKLHASDGMDIVLMERFEDLTKSVDCHGQDGILSLTFKSKAAFNRALEAWSFINEAEEIQFLLITNHEDCSPSDQRRPYV